MKIKTTVSIQPKEVPNLLNKFEMNQLISIIDKLLSKGIKLDISYKSCQK